MFKKLYNKLFGKLEYRITIINCAGSAIIHTFTDKRKVDGFINEINKDQYYQIMKIEKLRIIDFNYNKEILRKPLWFNNDGVTELVEIPLSDGTPHKFCYLKSPDNFKNVKTIKI